MNNTKTLWMNNISIIRVNVEVSQMDIFKITFFKRECKLKIISSFTQIKQKQKYLFFSSNNK